MKLIFRLVILTILACKVQSGYCSDSIYIKFAWGGEVDKPYNEFLFHKSGSLYPDQYGNPWVGIFELTDEQFYGLKSLLIDSFSHRENRTSSREWCTNYFIGYFNGEQILSWTNILDQDDLIHMSRLMKGYFKGTGFADKINSRWEGVFSRLGIRSG